LRTYKRISSISNDEEKLDVRKNLKIASGPPPSSVDNLLEYAVLKSMSERLRISSIERQGSKVAIRFHPETPIDPAALVSVVRSRKALSSIPAAFSGWKSLAESSFPPQ